MIPCHTCNGTGRIQMSAHLAKVLRSVGRGNNTAPKIALDLQHKGRSPTSINNALEDLRRLWFVTRTKMKGNAWSYQSV